VFFEGLAPQFDTAPLAVEVLRVVHPPDGVDARVSNGLHAERALGREQRVEVRLAVGVALVLDVVAVREGLPAVLAHEVLWVVLLVHCVHHLANDHLTAHCARRAGKHERPSIRSVSCRDDPRST